MKLKNKKTGEIGYLRSMNWDEIALIIMDKNGVQLAKYSSLAELNAEWEDYEEPKEYWYIGYDGKVFPIGDHSGVEDMKQIGNYFETEEKADKAVEKLKAWKRLKDKGFRFGYIRSIDGITMKHKELDQYTIIAYADEDGCDRESLDLLFGGEE